MAKGKKVVELGMASVWLGIDSDGSEKLHQVDMSLPGVDISLPVYTGVYMNPDTWRGFDISLPVYTDVYMNPDTCRGVDISLPVYADVYMNPDTCICKR